MARNNGMVDTIVNSSDPEIGKLAVAFSKWSMALKVGVEESDFDDFMEAHLKFIDADVDGDREKYEHAEFEIERWEQLGG